jgi:hypothetical protein
MDVIPAKVYGSFQTSRLRTGANKKNLKVLTTQQMKIL